MSRSISLGYWDAAGNVLTPVEVDLPYDLLGTQSLSKEFWAIARLREVGITRLTELGDSDPAMFVGWDMMDDLWREITLLQRHLKEIEFYPEVKARWASHLVYCYLLLDGTAPRESVPLFMIG